MTLSLIGQALSDPESLTQVKTNTIYDISEYRLAWAYYKSRMFTPGADWSAYLTNRGLYKYTRLVFNPVSNIVDFYVDNIWSQAKNHTHPSLITPLLDETDEPLIEAVAQLDQWGNWWRDQHDVKAFGAATGNVLIEIIDDDERQKVTHKVIWAGFVTDINLNDNGDVLNYTVEYQSYDAARKETYQFKKIVDREKIQYFKNDKPFAYEGKTAVMQHFYGFCPAVWIKHRGSGIYGEACFTDFNKVNDLNSLASHLHDNIHKEIESGKVIFAEKPENVTVISGASKNKDGSIREVDPRLERVVLGMAGQGSIEDLSGLLKLAEADPYLTRFIKSFGDDYPELEYRQIIKENGQLSGIALERLLTPAQNRLDRAAPNYDGQLIKLRQMQIAIAGWRTRNGWTNLTKQQRKFTPFGLDSYNSGELDFNLKRSVLVELTEDEREDLLSKKLDNANKAQGLYPLKDRILLTGKSEDEANLMMQTLAREDAVIQSRMENQLNGQAA